MLLISGLSCGLRLAGSQNVRRDQQVYYGSHCAMLPGRLRYGTHPRRFLASRAPSRRWNVEQVSAKSVLCCSNLGMSSGVTARVCFNRAGRRMLCVTSTVCFKASHDLCGSSGSKHSSPRMVAKAQSMAHPIQAPRWRVLRRDLCRDPDTSSALSVKNIPWACQLLFIKILHQR